MEQKFVFEQISTQPGSICSGLDPALSNLQFHCPFQAVFILVIPVVHRHRREVGIDYFSPSAACSAPSGTVRASAQGRSSRSAPAQILPVLCLTWEWVQISLIICIIGLLDNFLEWECLDQKLCTCNLTVAVNASIRG